MANLIALQSVITSLKSLQDDIKAGNKPNNITVELLEGLDGIESGKGQDIFDALKDTYNVLTYDDIDSVWTLNVSKPIDYVIEVENLVRDIKDGIDEAGFSFKQLLSDFSYNSVEEFTENKELYDTIVTAISGSNNYSALLPQLAKIGAFLQGIGERAGNE